MNADKPDVLSLQPVPVDVDVYYVQTGRGWATTISRDWASADDARRCRLCPRSECTARGRDHCTVVVDVLVDADSAALFPLTTDTRWVDPQARIEVGANRA